MDNPHCDHQWQMTNVSYGYIITEKCFHCDKIMTYFTVDDKHPMEEYREGDHFWNVMEVAQSFRFDLACSACAKIVSFDELLGIMLCTGCDETCRVNELRAKLAPNRTWLYVAWGFLPSDEMNQPSEEKITLLEQYFNQRRRSKFSRIKIVSSASINSIATCNGEVIKDVFMLSLQPQDKTQSKSGEIQEE